MKAVSKKPEGPSSKKPEGPSSKKIIKKVISKGGTPPVLNKSAMKSAEQSPIAKNNDNLNPTENLVNPVGMMPEGADDFKDLKTDAINVQVASKFEVARNEVATKVGIDANATEPKKIEEKPKTKKVVVKKKVIVVKKSSASAISSTSERTIASNPVTTGEKVDNNIGCTLEHITSTGMLSENAAGKEAKPTIMTSEKPKKIIKRVIIRKKGSATGPKEEKLQNLEVNKEKKNDDLPAVHKIDGVGKTDASKSDTEEALSQVEVLSKAVPDGVDEHEKMVPAVEELQFDDNRDVVEEPEIEVDAVEERGASRGIAPTRPLSERQKRKKLEVFVGGLDKDATEDDLRAAFQPVGDIVEVRLMMNPVTGKNKGYAFIRFASSEQAVLAATEYSVMQIRGKECGVLPNQDNDTLFIGNISRDWKSSEVLQKLKEYGVNGIEDLTMIGDPQNEALNRGYAFLELSTHYDALNAYQQLQRPGVTFGYDRAAKISWAQPLAEADASTMSQVKSVFVDGIPPSWTEDLVKQNFGKFGEIERIVLARNMPFAKRKDFAFVNFSSRESALACIQAFNNTELTNGDRKVKVKVSLTRPLHRGKVDKPFRYSGYPGHGRGRAGRGEGWFSTRFGERGAGRGFGRSSSGGGMVARSGKRLYDEDEVRMLLKAAREQEGWSSTTGRGRGAHSGRVPRGMTRGAYAQNEETQYYDAEHAESFRQQEEGMYMHDAYSRAPSNLEASRGNATKPSSIRDTHEPHYPGASRGRVSQLSEQYVSPHHDGAYHHRYEQSPMYGGDEGTFAGGTQDYNDMGVGMKRPASAWDEDVYESSHRGYPRARVDYSDHPEVSVHYPSHTRSPVGPPQTLGVRQGRSTRESPMPLLYESGSGLGKSGPTYNDHSYNSIPQETSTYPLDSSERRETSMYPAAIYGGHGPSVGYDFHSPGYY